VKEEYMAEKTTEVVPRERQTLAHREPPGTWQPFGPLERFADEMDRVFEDFGLGRRSISPRWGRGWLTTPTRVAAELWALDIEVYQRNNNLVVRADLPGIKRDDVCVDITDDSITISGDRHQEQEVERGGIYRSERSYGSFCRTISLPEGAITDQAKATFRDGVLEVTMPAPPEQVTRGRRLEIKEGSETKK
jgi:HSP20 family protein